MQPDKHWIKGNLFDTVLHIDLNYEEGPSSVLKSGSQLYGSH